MRTAAILAVAFGALVGCADSESIIAPEQEFSVAEARENQILQSGGSYEITVTNLTTLGGQWFTPPLVAVHRKAEDFFTAGKAASDRLMGLAENGDVPSFAADLEASPHVSGVTVGFGAAGPLAPSESVTVSLSADPGSNFVSFASMLICTNDGFTGVDGAKLPKGMGEEIEIYVGAYDAGTEINTEDFADIVPPCQAVGGVSSDDPGTGMSDPALAENGVIQHHDGVAGRSDLVPGIHGWMGPVAKFTVKRTG